MGDKDAKVTLGVDGADDVARAADRALRPWSNAINGAKTAWQGMGAAVADSIRSVTSDVARGLTAFAAFDFASSIPTVIAYREEVARLSVVAGQSSEQLRAKFATQERVTFASRQENEQLAKSLGRITYDYRGAADAASALGSEAIASNRSLGEMTGISKLVHEATGSFTAIPEVLGRIRAQADAMKTIGGPDALRDQIEGLSGAISRLSVKTPADLGRVTAAAAALGKGLRPEAAARVQQQVFSDLAADPVGWERFLRGKGELRRGDSIRDAQGHVKPEALGMIQRAWRKGVSRHEAERLATLYWGAETGTAFVNADLGAAGAVSGAAPSTGAVAAAAAYAASPEGQRKAKALATRGAQQDVAAEALPAVDAVLGFAAEHPVVAGIGKLLAPALVSRGVYWGLGKGIGALTGAGGRALATEGAAQLAASGGRQAALEAAANGGWLTASGLGGGLLGTALRAAGPLGLAAQGMYYQGQAVAELGEDRASMGARWRREHGVPIEMTEAYAVAKRKASQVYEEDAPLTAYRAARDAGASKEEAEEIARAIASTPPKVEVTIVNQTGGPIQALDQQGAGSASGQQ